MNGGDDFFSKRRIDPLAALLGDAEVRAQEALGGSGAQADEYLRLQRLQFGVEPGLAGGDFAGAGFLVDAAFAARLPFKMFDSIGDVNFRAIEAGGGEGLVQEFAGRADERFAREVFLMARLLTDEDDSRTAGAFAKDRLGGVLPQRAGAAVARGNLEFGDAGARRNRRRGRNRARGVSSPGVRGSNV